MTVLQITNVLSQIGTHALTTIMPRQNHYANVPFLVNILESMYTVFQALNLPKYAHLPPWDRLCAQQATEDHKLVDKCKVAIGGVDA